MSLWQTDKRDVDVKCCSVQVWKEDVELVVPLGLQTVHSIVCEDLVHLGILGPAIDEIVEVCYDLGGLQTSQLLFFNGNLVSDWF